jgi:His Kinase A (phospho-acceptor) domain
VRYDDRLLTVLNQPAGNRHDAAVRWRQLVDLIARAGPNSASPMVARAIDDIRSGARQVDRELRAAAARAVAALPLPLGLLEYFASDELAVSAPVLAAATLESAQWRVLIEIADAETRRFIETLHPELKPVLSEAAIGAAPTEIPEAPVEFAEQLVEPRHPRQAAPEPPPEPTVPSLHDVVERIERRRRSRELQQASNGAPIEESVNPLGLFRWECGPTGEIAWVEGAPRGPLIGRSIARAGEGEGDRVDAQVVRAFAMRAAFRDGALTVAGAGPVSGEWRISGVPAFEPADGRFAGYRGVALRETPVTARAEPGGLLPDPDSLRELVHEIKTPLNAIIGFAEIIDGQFLGPADRTYRERAAEIVAQARMLLTAIDDLDFAAKLSASAPNGHQRVNIGTLVEQLVPSLRQLASERGVELDASRTMRELTAIAEPELADRLIMRLCSAVIERAGAGEKLRLSVDQPNSSCRVSISRPAAMTGASDAGLFGGGVQDAQGFSLRLVRGLARIAGAQLVTLPGAIALDFLRA